MDGKATPIHEEKKSLSQKILFQIFSSLAFILHALPSLFIISIFAYFFGYRLILDSLSGNDALNNLNYIVFLSKYFPHIPLWYPYQGAGQSITLGYPQLYSYMVIILRNITGFTTVSTMGVINFLSLLFTAWGCYFFVALRLKNKTGGLLAGIFYTLSPMAYVWLWGAGFLAQTSSLIFVPWYLIAFDYLLQGALQKKLRRVGLLTTVVLGLIAFLAHPVTLMGLLTFGLFYATGMVFLEREGKFLERVVWVGGVFVLASIATIAFSAFWYLPLQEYLGYANQGIGGSLDTSVFAPIDFKGILGLWSRTSGYPYDDFSVYTPLWIMGLIGAGIGLFLNKKATILGVMTVLSIYFAGSLTVYLFFAHVSFTIATLFTLRPWFPIATVVTPISAAMGAVLVGQLLLIPLARLEKRNMNAVKLGVRVVRFVLHPVLTIFAAGFFLFLFNPLTGYYDSARPWQLPLGWTAGGINMHAVWNRTNKTTCDAPEGSPKRSTLCDVSNLSKYVDIGTLFSQCDALTTQKPDICLSSRIVTKGVYCNISAYQNTRSCRQSNQLPYGAQISVPLMQYDIDQFIASCEQPGFIKFYPANSPCLAIGKDTWSQLRTWPTPYFSYGKDNYAKYVDDFKSLAGKYADIVTGENHRIDVTPHLGSTVKSWNVLYNSSILNAYTGQLSIIKTYYSIFNDLVYDNRTTPIEIINSLAHYFGTEALIVNASTSPMDSFATGGWKRIGGETSIVIPPFPTGLITIGKLPKILVIGNQKQDAYKEVFKSGILGAVPFDDGILVQGPEKLGTLSLTQLSSYAGIVLLGYGYTNRTADLASLTTYIQNGGSVFIDTGWQYASADWGLTKNGTAFTSDLPDPFPVAQTAWESVGKDWTNGKLDQTVAKGISLSGFGTLSWEGNDWNVAGATNLSDGAHALLKKGDTILVASKEIGAGKIVWSGMNLLAHTDYTKSQDERNFVTNLFQYLLAGKKGQISTNYTISRPAPEQLVVTLSEPIDENTTVYFKESSYPSWGAEIIRNGVSQQLPISIAGPRFMVVSTPALSAGDKIIFTFHTPFSLIVGSIVSVGVFILLVLLIIDGLLGQKLSGLLHKSALMPIIQKGHGLMKKRLKRIEENFSKEEEDY